ncbi:hypothetical protein HY486_04830 [Candidatus Woesearchaeota archaeon]|nr:hypothetical protein [Candidatus Woesearchaeota archaeon]
MGKFYRYITFALAAATAVCASIIKRQTTLPEDFNLYWQNSYTSVSAAYYPETLAKRRLPARVKAEVHVYINGEPFVQRIGKDNKQSLAFRGDVWNNEDENARTLPELEGILNCAGILKAYSRHPESLDPAHAYIVKDAKDAKVEVIYVIDPDNEIAESNEADNRLRMPLNNEQLERLRFQLITFWEIQLDRRREAAGVR